MIRTEEAETVLKIENIASYILDVMKSSVNIELSDVEKEINLQDKLDTMERKIIIDELDKKMWNVSRTAESLGVTRQSLIYRMKKLNINKVDL